MKAHLKYLSYIVRHKWFVFLACLARGRMHPDLRLQLIWRGIIHDWTKLLPSEWFPYVASFYGRRPELERQRELYFLSDVGVKELDGIRLRFDIAWLNHQHRNSHHWQHWVLSEDSGKTKLIKMPKIDLLEMLADWDGAGRAIHGGKGNTANWYQSHYWDIKLHPETRNYVDDELGLPPF